VDAYWFFCGNRIWRIACISESFLKRALSLEDELILIYLRSVLTGCEGDWNKEYGAHSFNYCSRLKCLGTISISVLDSLAQHIQILSRMCYAIASTSILNSLASLYQVLDEAARSLHDALCVIRCLVNQRYLIAGWIFNTFSNCDFDVMLYFDSTEQTSTITCFMPTQG
jgi:hypothetical protein